MPNEGPDCVASGKLMALLSPAVQDCQYKMVSAFFNAPRFPDKSEIFREWTNPGTDFS
jgi:hypothetical protein